MPSIPVWSWDSIIGDPDRIVLSDFTRKNIIEIVRISIYDRFATVMFLYYLEPLQCSLVYCLCRQAISLFNVENRRKIFWSDITDLTDEIPGLCLSFFSRLEKGISASPIRELIRLLPPSFEPPVPEGLTFRSLHDHIINPYLFSGILLFPDSPSILACVDLQILPTDERPMMWMKSACLISMVHTSLPAL